MIDINRFDCYYIITCSRGFGNEAATVNAVPRTNLNDFTFVGDPEKDLMEFGLFTIETFWNDEGVVFAFPKGTKPLNGVYRWLLRENSMELSVLHDLSQLGVTLTQSRRAQEAWREVMVTQDAYVNACLRAFILTKDQLDDNPWAYTTLSSKDVRPGDILSKEQFERFMHIVARDVDTLLDWPCAVIRESARAYQQSCK